MYPLLPWKWLVSSLGIVVAIAIYADDLAILRIPTDPDARSNDIRTAIPTDPDKLTRRL